MIKNNLTNRVIALYAQRFFYGCSADDDCDTCRVKDTCIDHEHCDNVRKSFTEFLNEFNGKNVKIAPKELTDRYPEGQYECPVCGCGVGHRATYHTSFGEMQSDKIIMCRYCPNCGQAIKWEEDGNAEKK